MNRRTLLEHLAQAEQHVARGAGYLERERALIEERRQDGYDVKEAERLLKKMEQLHQMDIEHLEEVRKELAGVP
jgi:hypothetical protein